MSRIPSYLKWTESMPSSVRASMQLVTPEVAMNQSKQQMEPQYDRSYYDRSTYPRYNMSINQRYETKQEREMRLQREERQRKLIEQLERERKRKQQIEERLGKLEMTEDREIEEEIEEKIIKKMRWNEIYDRETDKGAELEYLDFEIDKWKDIIDFDEKSLHKLMNEYGNPNIQPREKQLIEVERRNLDADKRILRLFEKRRNEIEREIEGENMWNKYVIKI